MSPPRITPSALPRLQRCLGSACLPHSARTWEDASRGTALHAYMEARAEGVGYDEALAAVPEEWHKDASAIDVPDDWTSGSAEVGIALDLERRTARLLGKRMSREQVREALLPGEMGMLVDWLAQGDDEAKARDLKTGWQEDLAPADDHLQLITYAAAALLALGVKTVSAELWHWTGTRWRVDRTELDWIRAWEVLDQVQELTVRAAKARERYEKSGQLPTLTVGDHCSWCPSRPACSALREPVLAVLSGNQVLPVELTPETAGAALVRLRQAERWIQEAIANLKLIARSTPLVLPGGKVMRLEEVETTSVDVDAAVKLLAQVYGEEVAQAAVKTESSMPWARLLEVLKARVLQPRRDSGDRKATAAGLKREARKLLEGAGAVRVSTHSRLVEVRPELDAGHDELQERTEPADG